MNRTIFRTLVVCICVLALGLTVSAGTTSKNIELREAAKLGGKTIEKGMYRIDITDDGKITVKKGKDVVAEGTGQWVDTKTSAIGDTIVVDKGTITEVRIEGKKRVFQIS